MDASRNHERIQQIFRDAASLPAEERERYLKDQCSDESERREVQELLKYDEVKGGGLTGDFDNRFLPTVNVQLNASPSGSSNLIDHGRFLPGTVLSNRYRIVGMLGKGGMGEVYRADDLELGQAVALKFLPKKVVDDPRSMQRFRSEVRLARQVSHPNVCRVYDIGQIDRQWFLSMEYVDGEDLAQLLRRIGRFNADRATELARQLCIGLHAAHEKGVLHRDLKPANIMIDGRGKLLITDFGLAEIADDNRAEDIRSGTPAYMSPEQLAGREVTERSDIYSLGIVLHEIYTGKRVWDAGSMAELLEKRRHSTTSTPTSSNESVDPVVERVIQRCLEPDPAKRPQSAMRVLASLPGGDPLQAAIMAGELPSPEMIAESGDVGNLPLRTGGFLFATLCVLLGAIPFVWGAIDGFNFGQLAENEPAVLVRSAQEHLQQFGYESRTATCASGFRFPSPGIYEFWYRQGETRLSRAGGADRLSLTVSTSRPVSVS